MGRGVSAGGGQSSLGYLFGSGAEAAATPPPPSINNQNPQPPESESQAAVVDDKDKHTPATITAITTNNSTTNNYFRSDGQNCGNFITDRPSTKVHAAPGGGSSLSYLFGDGKK